MGAIDEAAAPAGGLGAGGIGRRIIPPEQGLGRGDAQPLLGGTEEGGVGFFGADLAGDKDGLEPGAEFQGIQEAVEAPVPVGEDGAADAAVAELFKNGGDFRENAPEFGTFEGGVNFFEVVIERKIRGEGRGGPGAADEVFPPAAVVHDAGALDGIARLEGVPGGDEALVEEGGIGSGAVVFRDLDVSVADGAGGAQEGAAGVDEHGEAGFRHGGDDAREQGGVERGVAGGGSRVLRLHPCNRKGCSKAAGGSGFPGLAGGGFAGYACVGGEHAFFRAENRAMMPAMQAHPAGALWWPEEGTLALADLHLEKGSSRAARGVWLPPYDTLETLARLEAVVEELRPRRVLCLGDAFEDRGAWRRMETGARERLAALAGRAEWTWIAGNHDPGPVEGLPGRFAGQVEVGGVAFCHQPGAEAGVEVGVGLGRRVFGHYHPKATVVVRGRRITGRCFLATDQEVVLPAFGKFTGGLDREDPALRAVLRGPARTWLLHRGRVHVV